MANHFADRPSVNRGLFWLKNKVSVRFCVVLKNDLQTVERIDGPRGEVNWAFFNF
jgi:hypothetical protein